MLDRSRSQALAALGHLFAAWPWLIVAAVGVWLTWPLWAVADVVFAGQLSTDNVVSAWYYDFISRSLAHGELPQLLTDFDWPRPVPRRTEFPSLVDAVLVAPAGWLLGWPRQYGAAQSLAMLVSGLGTAALARAAGARGPGVVVAGVLGLVCRPLWKDLVMGRMNAVWPGFLLGALAAWLAVFRTTSWPGRITSAVVAALLGAAGTLIYPPFAVMLLPIALALGAGPFVDSRWAVRGLGLIAIVGAVALALPEMLTILEGQVGRAGCAEMTCPDAWWAVRAEHLFLVETPDNQGLSRPGVALTAWLLAPLALLHSRRKAAFMVILVILGYALLSLGPCPSWGGGILDLPGWPRRGWDLGALWCALSSVHDWARFATIGALSAAVLAGLAVEAGPRPWRWLVGIGAVGLLVHAVSFQLDEALDAHKWHAVETEPAAAFLADAEPGPVVELPFDRKHQFLSVLAAPGSPRLNPLRPGGRPRSGNQFIDWIHGVGRGDIRTAPDRVAVSDSDVRWVLFDPQRCNADAQLPGCGSDVTDALSALLGPPGHSGLGLWIWDLQRLSTETPDGGGAP